MIKELNYDLTKEDVFKFFYFHHFKNKIELIVWLIILLIFIFSSVCLYLCDPTDKSSLFVGIGFTILAFFLFIIIPVIGVLKFEKIKLNIKISSESSVIVYDNTYGHSEIKWSQMYKLYKSKHLFLIYMTKNQAIIIPKRIFESEQEMNETWELIQECYNKNREDKR